MIELENLPDVVKKQVAEGQRVMLLENESQRMIAIQAPRDPAKALKNAFRELDAFPDFAKAAYYSIPYKDRSGEDEKTVMVEGLSIKAAMSLFGLWGNASNGARVVEEQSDQIIVEGVFLDYENNTRTLRQIAVRKTAWNRRTKTVEMLREDRLNLAIAAGMSKAVRNAILASLPEGLKAAYFQKAREIVAGAAKGKSAKELLEEVLSALNGEYEIKKLDVARILGKQSLKMADVLHLQGMLTALRDGQIKKEDLLAGKKVEVNQDQSSITLGGIKKAN